MISHNLYYLFFLPSTFSSSKSFLASSSFCKSSPQLPPTHPLQPLRSASTSREQSEQVEGEEEELMVEELDTVRMRRWHITGRPAECSKFKYLFTLFLCVGNRSFAHRRTWTSSSFVRSCWSCWPQRPTCYSFPGWSHGSNLAPWEPKTHVFTNINNRWIFIFPLVFHL